MKQENKTPLVAIQTTEENEKRQINILIAGHIPIHFDLHRTTTPYQEEVFKEWLGYLDQVDIVDIYGVQSPQSQFIVKVVDDDENTDTTEFQFIWKDTGGFVASMRYRGGEDEVVKVYMLSYLLARMKIAILTNKYAKPPRRHRDQTEGFSGKSTVKSTKMIAPVWYYPDNNTEEKKHE